MEKLSFKQLNIHSDIIKALDEMGFEYPTEIQEKAIPYLTDNQSDFVGQAQTGTGKTAAFLIPLLSKIDFSSRNVQALILTPTRELAHQVEAEIKKLGKFTDVKSLCVYGGTGYDTQIRSLKREFPQIVVGTPGRVIDLLNKRILKLDNAKYCVLDEADEMLNMGFLDDVQHVISLFGEERQLIMFSATMPRTILSMVKSSFNDYELVKIKSKSLSNDNIEQKFFIIRDKHFKEALNRLIDDTDDMYGIVFCRTKIETTDVGNDLKKKGHKVEVLNGDMGQHERDRAMRNFKERKVNIMVCTDVAARGIDVTNLTHVFNYGLPQNNEAYVHRIGRTGRAGSHGKAFTLVGPSSSYAIKKIERHINNKIEYARLPSVGSLKQKMVERELVGAEDIMKAIVAKGDDFKADASFVLFKEKFGELEQEELLQLMFTWKFNKVMRHYNNLPDIEGPMKSGGGGGYSRGGGGRGRGPRRGPRGGSSRDGGGYRRGGRDGGGDTGYRRDRDGDSAGFKRRDSSADTGYRRDRDGDRSARPSSNGPSTGGGRSFNRPDRGRDSSFTPRRSRSSDGSRGSGARGSAR